MSNEDKVRYPTQVATPGAFSPSVSRFIQGAVANPRSMSPPTSASPQGGERPPGATSPPSYSVRDRQPSKKDLQRSLPDRVGSEMQTLSVLEQLSEATSQSHLWQTECSKLHTQLTTERTNSQIALFQKKKQSAKLHEACWNPRSPSKTKTGEL